MPNWLRALIAGYGAKKLGGGCFSTIIIFVVIYYALGQCNHPVHHGVIMPVKPATQTAATAAGTTRQMAATMPGGGVGQTATTRGTASVISCTPTIIPVTAAK